MGGILLVIGAAVIIVITALLSNTIDSRLETAQGIIIEKQKLKVNDLGKVQLRLRSADISSDVYVQVWGLDGELQSNFGTLDNFADQPFDPDTLHADRPI